MSKHLTILASALLTGLMILSVVTLNALAIEEPIPANQQPAQATQPTLIDLAPQEVTPFEQPESAIQTGYQQQLTALKATLETAKRPMVIS